MIRKDYFLACNHRGMFAVSFSDAADPSPRRTFVL
jgi:hypothetical protein